MLFYSPEDCRSPHSLSSAFTWHSLFVHLFIVLLTFCECVAIYIYPVSFLGKRRVRPASFRAAANIVLASSSSSGRNNEPSCPSFSFPLFLIFRRQEGEKRAVHGYFISVIDGPYEWTIFCFLSFLTCRRMVFVHFAAGFKRPAYNI